MDIFVAVWVLFCYCSTLTATKPQTGSTSHGVPGKTFTVRVTSSRQQMSLHVDSKEVTQPEGRY